MAAGSQHVRAPLATEHSLFMAGHIGSYRMPTMRRTRSVDHLPAMRVGLCLYDMRRWAWAKILVCTYKSRVRKDRQTQKSHSLDASFVQRRRFRLCRLWTKCVRRYYLQPMRIAQI